jgi:hypothetical protein
MNHPLLDGHEKIAWDMDGTLIAGRNSAYFCRYIIANPQKEHHIVTFRTPRRWAEQALDELEEQGVARNLIAGVHNVPDDIWEAFAIKSGAYDPVKVAAYLEYKGLTAFGLGCTVLVDDMSALVAAGCLKHGVCFLDAEKLFFGD